MNMNKDTPINELLRKRRKDRKITQLRVAIDIGISSTYYNQIEIGSRKPGKKVAIKLSEYFGIDLRRLIE
jgi:transcriptional regulator with XRE-family HTH domain